MVRLIAKGWAVPINPASGGHLSTTWHGFSEQGLAGKPLKSLCGQTYGDIIGLSELRSYTRIPRNEEACFYCVGVLKFKKDSSSSRLSPK